MKLKEDEKEKSVRKGRKIMGRVKRKTRRETNRSESRAMTVQSIPPEKRMARRAEDGTLREGKRSNGVSTVRGGR